MITCYNNSQIVCDRNSSEDKKKRKSQKGLCQSMRFAALYLGAKINKRNALEEAG